MSKRKKSQSPSKKKKTRLPGCTWNDGDSALLVKLLVAQKDAGMMSENGFKPSVYIDVARDLELQRPSRKGVAKSGKSAKAHWAKVSR
jgi:hypothetical protein